MPKAHSKKSTSDILSKAHKRSNQKCSKELVLRQFPVLRILLKSRNPRLRAELLRISPDTVHALCSIAHNVRAGNIPITSRGLKKRLSGINSELNILTSPKVSAKKKALALTSKRGQKGGFLSLLPRIIPGILSVLGLTSSN